MKNLNTSNYPTLEQNGFQVASLDKGSISLAESGLVRAYKEVFNASTWREGVKCSDDCGYKTTFEEAPEVCPDCGGGIEDYYSDAEISESLLSVMSKTYFQCLALLKDDKVAGFTWGWQNSLDQINTEKLGLNSSQYDELKENIEATGININSSWYYQSETGIVPQSRFKGVGSALISMNEELIQQNKDKVSAIIQRTSRKSPMYIIGKRLGYEEVFSYDDADERILFIKNNS
ncbi:MAG: hypothetical protein Q8K26_03520 [Candidatus Gracilibacteria bacterium]|nr:hypothetical protein [Candidatus Gracilibacteria bacterium]